MLYKAGHEFDLLLGDYSFAREGNVRVYISAHEGDSARLSLSVEHERAHQSLATGSNAGTVQMILARAGKQLTDGSWSKWLSEAVAHSWSTYEGFALEREAWIAYLHGIEMTPVTQSRYRDAQFQYTAIIAQLPKELRLWRFVFSRAIADFAMNSPLRDLSAETLFTDAGMIEYLSDRSRRPDTRLSRLSTAIERDGFDTDTVREFQQTIGSVFARFGGFADNAESAHDIASLRYTKEHRRFLIAIDTELTSIILQSFRAKLPDLDTECQLAERERIILEAKQTLVVDLPRLIDAEQVPWPFRADLYSVEYVHELQFDNDYWIDGSTIPDSILREMGSVPEAAAYVAWASPDLVCLMPLVNGPNTNPRYDPLRAPAASRRDQAESATIRFSGERFLFENPSPRIITFFTEKMKCGVYFADASENVVGPGWPSGSIMARNKLSEIILYLHILREKQIHPLRVVLQSATLAYIAFRDWSDDLILLEVPMELFSMIRIEDPSLWEWYNSVRVDATRLDDEVSNWGYMAAVMVLMGAIEPSKKRKRLSMDESP